MIGPALLLYVVRNREPGGRGDQQRKGRAQCGAALEPGDQAERAKPDRRREEHDQLRERSLHRNVDRRQQRHHVGEELRVGDRNERYVSREQHRRQPIFKCEQRPPRARAPCRGGGSGDDGRGEMRLDDCDRSGGNAGHKYHSRLGRNAFCAHRGDRQPRQKQDQRNVLALAEGLRRQDRQRRRDDRRERPLLARVDYIAPAQVTDRKPEAQPDGGEDERIDHRLGREPRRAAEEYWRHIEEDGRRRIDLDEVDIEARAGEPLLGHRQAPAHVGIGDGHGAQPQPDDQHGGKRQPARQREAASGWNRDQAHAALGPRRCGLPRKSSDLALTTCFGRRAPCDSRSDRRPAGPSMTGIRSLCAFALAALILVPCAAVAEPVFPPGSRVGLEPPPGMVPSKRFAGFEDAEHKAAILVLDLPAAAYVEAEQSLFAKPETDVKGLARRAFPFKEGIALLATGTAQENDKQLHKWFFLATTVAGPVPNLTAFITVEAPESARDIYTDAVVEKALKSVTSRKPPVDEQLALLPYALKDLAGFHV